jgi:hypothetical protein
MLCLVVTALALTGWLTSYIQGPDQIFSTLNRTKPVPVKVETVKWLTKTQVKTERVEIPVQVIRELPAKEAKRLESEFGITLPELQADNRELVTVKEIPKAPYGGELAITANTQSGAIDGIFRAKPRPFVEVGGLREAGVELNVLTKQPTAYYRQDLIRFGPAVIGGRAYATPGPRPDYGAAIVGSVRL